MKALIVGYGSIGKRHEKILNNLPEIDQVSIVSSQKIQNKLVYPNIENVDEIESYAYFVIANETALHFDALKAVNERVAGKSILVEKPLFSSLPSPIELKNKIFVAYNLRFHPIIKELRKMIAGSQVFSAQVVAGQYLPSWRPESNYIEAYSASIERGGGVLRDLSHEIDYTAWLLGEMKLEAAFSHKISNLEISSDDYFSCIAQSDSGAVVSMSLDYLSKIPLRKLTLQTESGTICADLVASTIASATDYNKVDVVEFPNMDPDETYRHMHKDVLGDGDYACNFIEGLSVLKFIRSVEFKGTI